jgi:Protein of unknown function (DUF4236)
MGYFRFSRRVRIAPGVHLNLSKTGMSMTLGGPGASLNIGRRSRATLGMPGTGLSYVEPLSDPGAHRASRWPLYVVLLVLAGAMLWAAVAHAQTITYSEWMGRRTCLGPDGYHSTESTWMGRTTGQDNRGNHWTTTEWMGRETTINRRSGQ